MKFFSISVNFFARDTKKSLYERHYTILAEDEAHARAVIINHLTLLDFYNFEITGVQEVGNIEN